MVRFLLRRLLKPIVVGPYTKNSRTAADLMVTDERVLEIERKRLTDHINQVRTWGVKHFQGRDNHSLGVMTAERWNNLFAKHLEHHLVQFGL